MTSRAKRRKKNDESSQPVRGLDYFFAKQAHRSKQVQNTDAFEDGAKTTNQIGSELTDEEVARRLQEEYNLEYKTHLNKPSAENRKAEKSQSPEIQSTQHGAGPALSTSSILPSRVGGVKTLALQSTTDDEDTITGNIPFDESPLTFDPTDYTPQLRTHWAADKGHATYALLTRCFVLVNATTSRIKIVDTLVNMLRTIIASDPDSLLPAVGTLANLVVCH
jgi:DNA ligase 1